MVIYNERMATYVSISIPFPSINIHIACSPKSILTSPETKNNIFSPNLIAKTLQCDNNQLIQNNNYCFLLERIIGKEKDSQRQRLHNQTRIEELFPESPILQNSQIFWHDIVSIRLFYKNLSCFRSATIFLGLIFVLVFPKVLILGLFCF